MIFITTMDRERKREKKKAVGDSYQLSKRLDNRIRDGSMNTAESHVRDVMGYRIEERVNTMPAREKRNGHVWLID